MKNRIQLILLLQILLLACNKPESPRDLYPLKVGNEYYFSYSKTKPVTIQSTTKGVEVWKVISDSIKGNSIHYLIERKLNATELVPTINYRRDIIDAISYLEIIEDKSSSVISFWNISFRRYQDVGHIEISTEGGTSMPTTTFTFKADSGLVYYYYYHPTR